MNSNSSTLLDLSGQVALVTGAAGGLGLAVVEILAGRGGTVIATDANAEGLSRTYGSSPFENRVITCAGDITEEGFVEHLISLCPQQGSLDILVNNAGILQRGSILDISSDQWDRMMSVNVKAMFMCIRAAVPIMRQKEYGRIVNISSDAGKAVSTLGGCHYTASKAAVLGLTRHLGRELAFDGILVNAVCPGLIDTQMSRTNSRMEEWDSICAGLPQKRASSPREIATMVAFLCSSAASGCVGATVDVNGGSYFC